ncbi:MAG: HD domain-containing phosphohydrolase, partial [Fusobacteriota bacterium]
MKLDMKRFLQGVSLALDLAELDYLKVNLNHSRRVAYICMMIADKMDFSKKEKSDLYAYSILHDNGLVVSNLKEKEDYENMPGHCIEGEANIIKLNTYMYKRRKNIIKYHHENYDGTGIFGIKDKDIHIFSHIIHLADRIDTNFNLIEKAAEKKESIKAYIINQKEKMFHPDVVEASLEMMEKCRFWFDLDFYNIDEVLNRVTPHNILDMSWKEILEMTDILVEIIDSKSRFTHMHTKGLVKKIKLMCNHYELDKDKTYKLMIAGNLHDLGKLYVPNSILDKPEKLDDFEFIEIKHHTYYTKLALDKIPGFEDISRWASNHHEKLNGKGYPEGYTGKDLDFESRLIGVLDIYQALTEERPYRSSLSHEKTMKILCSMVEGGFIDGDITKDVEKVMRKNYGDKNHEETRLVIAEDDKTSLKLMDIYISKKGITVDRANNGKELMKLLKRRKYKMIFLDISMPEMDGLEAASKIRKLEK